MATAETSNILKIMAPDWKHRGKYRRKEFVRVNDGLGLAIEAYLDDPGGNSRAEFVLFDGIPWYSPQLKIVRLALEAKRLAKDRQEYSQIGWRVCRAYGEACKIWGVEE